MCQQKFYILRLESNLHTPETDHHETSYQMSFRFSGSLAAGIWTMLPTPLTVLLYLLPPHLDICSSKNLSDWHISKTFWGSLNGLIFPKFSGCIPNTVTIDGPVSTCMMSRQDCCSFTLNFHASIVFVLPPSPWSFPRALLALNKLIYCIMENITWKFKTVGN